MRSGTVSRSLVFVLLCLLLPTARAAPAAGGDSVATDVRALLARSGPAAGTYGFCLAEARTGKILFSAEAHTPRMPASTMKLVTSGAAVLDLGSGFVFRTEARSKVRPDRSGVLAGDLVIVGGGDPSLDAARWLQDSPGRIEELVDSLVRSGLRRVDGNLVLDDSLFDRQTRGPDWPSDQLDRSYCAPVSALVVEKSCVTVRAEPGPKPGAPARISLLPETSVLTIRDEMTTTGSGKSQKIVYSVTLDGSTLVARGKIFTGCPHFDAKIAVPHPTAYFGDVLKRALVRAGVAVTGKVVRGPGAGKGAGQLLASLETPLFDVLTEMNRDSVNLYADCVLKTLGALKGKEGSFAGGAKVTAELAGRIGVPAGELSQVDGSGLSRTNKVSPYFLLRLLCYVYGTPNNLAFMKTLSIAGYDGTLEHRMKDLGADVRAKTGTINGVSALAGYVKAKSGRVFAFAFLENDSRMHLSAARHLQDEICRMIHEKL